MNSDGLSYLDLASEALHNGPAGLLNGYWSPGYPALLSLALALFRPSPDQEFPLIHLVNFFIFVLTLSAFHFFLRRWLLLPTDTTGPKEETKSRDILPVAYSLFLWFTLTMIGVRAVTPDLCVAAVVFLVAGATCRLSLPNSGGRHYVFLGLALGLGYYAKAAMFPLGVFFLAGLLLLAPSMGVERQRRKLLLSLLTFLLVAAPLVAALSSRAGRLTFGDTGRLNYAWYVNGLPRFTGWTGGSAAINGIPEHPPRTLMEKPLILEFAEPIKGTFPLWYDPSYWYAGARAQFNSGQQIAALKVTLRAYRGFFRQMAVFFAGAFVLGLFTVRKMRLPDLALRESWLVAWPLMATSMYALLHVESRFVGAFFVLLWLAIYHALMSRANRRLAVGICAAVVGFVMISFVVDVAAITSREVRALTHPSQPDYKTIGMELGNLGVRAGDRLAVAGYPFDAYYARYAGLRIVAEIPSADSLWNLSTPELEAIAGQLSQIGVKAVVAKNRADKLRGGRWRDLTVSGGERYSILLLSEALPRGPLR